MFGKTHTIWRLLMLLSVCLFALTGESVFAQPSKDSLAAAETNTHTEASAMPAVPGTRLPAQDGSQDGWAVTLSPLSPPAQTISDLFYLILGIMVVIFLVVGTTMAVLVFRFRAGRHKTDGEPPQIYGSKPIELAWTLGPAIIVFVLFLVTARSIFDIRSTTPPKDAIHVRVVGHQWWWEFQYLDHNITTANELHVPLSSDGTLRPVYLDLESADVIHSFWVPQLAGKTDLFPGRVNHMWFQPSQAGWFIGQCAEYCGTQHAHMWLRVKAESEDEFQKWVTDQQEPADLDSSVNAGRDLFLSNACANCHTIRGTHAKGIFGPDLTHLMSRETIASGIRLNNKDNLTQWVQDPQTIKEGCRMPDMKLTSDSVQKIVAYLLTLH
jgi:cytochrome c oxidase subunit 2